MDSSVSPRFRDTTHLDWGVGFCPLPFRTKRYPGQSIQGITWSGEKIHRRSQTIFKRPERRSVRRQNYLICTGLRFDGRSCQRVSLGTEQRRYCFDVARGMYHPFRIFRQNKRGIRQKSRIGAFVAG